MDYRFQLEFLDTLAIVVLAIILVAIAVIVASCLAIPGCIGYKCLHGDRRKSCESDQIVIFEIPKKGQKSSLNEVKNPLYESVGSQLKIIEPQAKLNINPELKFNGNYKPMTFLPDTMETPKKSPCVKLNLNYLADQDITSMGRLVIEIIDAENIPNRDYPSLPDTIVALDILHKRWSFQRHCEKVHYVQTRLVKSTTSPDFQQIFTFAATKAELKGWSIKIAVIDEDRLTRSREVCKSSIILSEIQGLIDQKLCPLTLQLEPVIDNLGQIQVALSYLPTAQRLSVSVTKGSKISWQKVTLSLRDFFPYVRVILLDHAGRTLKKKKIAGEPRVESPAFSGSLCFQLPPIVFETATLLLVVCSGVDGDKTDDNTEKKKRNVIGFAALGWMVSDDFGKEHWRAIMRTPRTLISHWHFLR